MKYIDKHLLFLIFGIFILNQKSLSQQITDVSFEVIDQNIRIFYTLTPVSNDLFEISTLLKRTTDVSFSYKPENLSGDIGEGKYSGNGRAILWNVTQQEMNMFDGEDFYFEVYAKKIEPSGGIPWYYYVGTAAVGGAAAVLLLGGSDDQNPPTTQSFPKPPDRP